MSDVANFTEEVVAGVTGHMNGDHPEDNLLIARAFGYPEATASRMVGVTGEAGVWLVADAAGEREVSVAWPGGAISERPEIRREVVALYKAACERLGVPAREEHQASAPAGGHHGAGAAHGHGSPHGHGGHGAAHEADTAEEGGEKPFSVILREGSWSDHSDSEGATFMEDIMRGKGTRQDYIDLVAQHFFMYEALEAATAKFSNEALYPSFHSAALVRMPALEADLKFLLGDNWREQIAPVPATVKYAARMLEVGEEGWFAGLIAHHYTRYLGDLSGGQYIAKRMAKQHELEAEGIAFYDFAELGDLNDFKNAYRVGLDELGASLDDAEKARMLDEVRAAYGFNTAVFVDLGQAKAAA